MKKALWIALLLASLCVLALSSCTYTVPQTPDSEHVHSFGEWKTIKEATCTVKGLRERVCACGVKESASAANGHTVVIDAAIDATCTTDGKTEGKHCSFCNETLVAQKTIPASHTSDKNNPHGVTASQLGLTTETWTFTLEDGSTVTKAVYVG